MFMLIEPLFIGKKLHLVLRSTCIRYFLYYFIVKMTLYMQMSYLYAQVFYLHVALNVAFQPPPCELPVIIVFSNAELFTDSFMPFDSRDRDCYL